MRRHRRAMGAILLWAALLLGPPDEYDATAANADVATLLADSGQAYLGARARLEANPAVAAPALAQALKTQPGEGPASRRLLRVLGEVGGEAYIERFAQSLRASLASGEGREPWRGLLLSQGSASTEALAALVADETLAIDDRLSLLDDLVDVVDVGDLPALAATLGTGEPMLSSHLRRALRRRARGTPTDGEVLIGALDELLAQATGPQRPDRLKKAALIRLRASIREDPQLWEWLATTALDESEAFAVRIAAIRALGSADPGADSLESVSERELAPARRELQSSEILGSTALDALGGLSPARAGALADALELKQADAPRLAAAGYAYGTWRNSMLDTALANPWPTVRVAALTRVAGPCESADVKLLSKQAGPLSRGGMGDERTGRAVVVALGNCGDEAAASLRKLVRDEGITYERRAVAARELIRVDGSAGADLVATILLATPPPALAERLTSVLEHTPDPSEKVLEALCHTLETAPNAATSVRTAMVKLFPGERCE